MTWENLIDTFLNIVVFAFIAFLLWLYLKREPVDKKSQSTKDE